MNRAMKRALFHFGLRSCFVATCYVALNVLVAKGQHAWASDLAFLLGLLIGTSRGRWIFRRMVIQGGIGAALGIVAIAPTLLWAELRDEGYVLTNWSLAPYFVIGTLALATAGFLLGIITTLLAAPVVLLVRGWMRVVDPLIEDHVAIEGDIKDEEVAAPCGHASNNTDA